VYLYCACNLESSSTVETKYLFRDLYTAQQLEAREIFVIDRSALHDLREIGAGYCARDIPSKAILNISPYIPPRAIIAAGGVIRHRVSDQILCIRRHGVLDLPKGKLDPGESVADCAMRELREETGIQDLVQGKLLGTTIHGYHRAGVFEVKTTYWYEFTSESMHFAPAVEEGIDAVFWISDARAEQTLGYPVLQKFLMDLRSVNQGAGAP